MGRRRGKPYMLSDENGRWLGTFYHRPSVGVRCGGLDRSQRKIKKKQRTDANPSFRLAWMERYGLLYVSHRASI